MQDQDKLEKVLWISALLLLIVGYFLNLGVQPLYLEEPRRAFISMELLENKNWIVPTLWGDFYYNKPPIFNWILILMTQLFGGFSEWSLRLPSVLSTFVIAWVIYRFVKSESGMLTARYAALLWLVNMPILFYFSMLAEIDLFFSMLVFSSLVSIYHYHKKERYWVLFTVLYLCTALAFLSKGLPALVFTALSLLAFFIWKKQFWKLFHPAHFAGIFLLFGIVGGYYYLYSKYNDPTPFLNRLLSESTDRTASGSSFGTFITHLLLFPFDFLKELIPAIFLLPFLIRKELRSYLRANDWLFFCFLMLSVNLIPYWLSPGTRMRYTYMLLPFGIIVLVAYWRRFLPTDKKYRSKISDALAGLVVFLLPLGAIALSFIPDFQFLNYLLPLSVLTAIAFTFLAYLFYKNASLRMLILLTALALGRIVFDATILPQRADSSGAQRNKALAELIYHEVQNDPLRIVTDRSSPLEVEWKIFSYTSTYYLNRLRGQVLRTEADPQFEIGHFYIMALSDVPPKAEILLTYPYHGQERALIKITE